MRYWYKKNKMQLLRGFCTVMEKGSVLQASKELGIAQSAVSLQITSLERDLEAPLFKREKGRLIPLPEAHKFYKTCKKFVDELDFMFENSKKMLKENIDDKVRIAAHSYMLSHILPPYFEEFLKHNKNARFELHNATYEEGLELLETGNVDFAIFPVSKHEKFRDMKVHEFYKCNFGITVHKSHPLAAMQQEAITWELLKQYDYITLREGVTAQGLKHLFRENGVESKFKLYKGTWEICLGIIKQGLSIGGGDVVYSSWHDDVVFIECSHLVQNYEFNIVTHNTFKPSKSSQELLKMLGVKKL